MLSARSLGADRSQASYSVMSSYTRHLVRYRKRCGYTLEISAKPHVTCGSERGRATLVPFLSFRQFFLVRIAAPPASSMRLHKSVLRANHFLVKSLDSGESARKRPLPADDWRCVDNPLAQKV